MESVEKYKIILLGDYSTGKTCILNRFMYDSYSEDYRTTVGIDFLSKTFKPKGSKKSCRLQLWDTAGQVYIFNIGALSSSYSFICKRHSGSDNRL